MERKDKKKCMYMEVEGARPRIKPRKAWLKVVKTYVKRLGLASADALDCIYCHLSYLFMLGGRM